MIPGAGQDAFVRIAVTQESASSGDASTIRQARGKGSGGGLKLCLGNSVYRGRRGGAPFRLHHQLDKMPPCRSSGTQAEQLALAVLGDPAPICPFIFPVRITIQGNLLEFRRYILLATDRSQLAWNFAEHSTWKLDENGHDLLHASGSSTAVPS